MVLLQRRSALMMGMPEAMTAAVTNAGFPAHVQMN
jgi:hypothetical protein